MIIIYLILLLVSIIFLFKRRKIVFNTILNKSYKIIWKPIFLIVLSGIFTALCVFTTKSMDRIYIGISAIFTISLEMTVYNFLCSNELYKILEKKEVIGHKDLLLFSCFYWLAVLPLSILMFLRTGLQAWWVIGIILLLGYWVYYEMMKRLKNPSKLSTKNLLPPKLRFKDIKKMKQWDIGAACLLMVLAIICNTFLPTKLLQNIAGTVIIVLVFIWSILINFNCIIFFEDSKKYAKYFIGFIIPPCLVIIYLVEYYFYKM